MSKAHILGLAGWLLASFAASAVGAFASLDAKSFYSQLVQPSWSPPPEVFGPVWTLLYFLMAIAAWLVWCRGGFSENRLALSLFLVQLVVNALWSWLFFTWRLGQVALMDITLLWLLIVATLFTFYRVRAIAGVLLVPYLLWVSFAWVLNLRLWQLNARFLG